MLPLSFANHDFSSASCYWISTLFNRFIHQIQLGLFTRFLPFFFSLALSLSLTVSVWFDRGNKKKKMIPNYQVIYNFQTTFSLSWYILQLTRVFNSSSHIINNFGDSGWNSMRRGLLMNPSSHVNSLFISLFLNIEFWQDFKHNNININFFTR